MGGILSGTCQYYDNNGIGALLKGSLCGMCFGFIKSGVIAGAIGGLIYNSCE